MFLAALSFSSPAALLVAARPKAHLLLMTSPFSSLRSSAYFSGSTHAVAADILALSSLFAPSLSLLVSLCCSAVDRSMDQGERGGRISIACERSSGLASAREERQC